MPLYATPFTAGLIAGKLEEEGLADKVAVNLIDMLTDFSIGPFGLRYIPLAHSIPEGTALVIETPYGRVFHTGDWKLDDEPVLGARNARVPEIIRDPRDVGSVLRSSSSRARPAGGSTWRPGSRSGSGRGAWRACNRP